MTPKTKTQQSIGEGGATMERNAMIDQEGGQQVLLANQRAINSTNNVFE